MNYADHIETCECGSKLVPTDGQCCECTHCHACGTKNDSHDPIEWYYDHADKRWLCGTCKERIAKGLKPLERNRFQRIMANAI